jgi:hypothetical protein
MKKLGKTLVGVSVVVFVFAVVTANVGVTLLGMAGITYSTALVTNK